MALCLQFLFCSLHVRSQFYLRLSLAESAEVLMFGPIRTFDVGIRRTLDVAELHDLTHEEAEAADERGDLGGNRLYQDLRACSWTELSGALEREHDLILEISTAPDPSRAEQESKDLRDDCDDAVESLLGLDVGVATAAFALAALGATPFMSCNAGSFGAPHQGHVPYVAFYLSDAQPQELLALATGADVGLEAEGGILRLYGRSILDLRSFAKAVLARHLSS